MPFIDRSLLTLFLLQYPLPTRGVYADLVTVAGFKPVVAAEKSPGGFDSLPLPWGLCDVSLQLTRNPAKTLKLNHFFPSGLFFQTSQVSRLFVSVSVNVA